MVAAAYAAYRQIEVATADPKRLIMLCYEGALQNLKTARMKLLSREYEEKGKAIQKVLDILGTLREALDFEKGGPIAEHLDLLYAFMTRQILAADRKKSVTDLDQVVSMLEILKSAWEEALFGSPKGSGEFGLTKVAQKPDPLRPSTSSTLTF